MGGFGEILLEKLIYMLAVEFRKQCNEECLSFRGKFIHPASMWGKSLEELVLDLCGSLNCNGCKLHSLEERQRIVLQYFGQIVGLMQLQEVLSFEPTFIYFRYFLCDLLNHCKGMREYLHDQILLLSLFLHN